MKRVFFILSLMLISVRAFSAEPAFIGDKPGLFITGPASEPMPITSTTGLPTTQAVAAAASTTNKIVATSSSLITALSGRKNLSVVVLDSGKEVWVNVGSDTASISPVGGSSIVRSALSLSAFGDSIPVAIVASETVNVAIIQY